MPFEIPLRLQNFYAGPDEIPIPMPSSWPELVGAAAFVGRDVAWATQPEPALLYAERVWRIAMVYACLTEHPAGHGQVRRSDAYATLDGSERGAVSFLLGQALAKHVAEKLLGATVFAHVDSALALLGLPITGVRPDFIGLCPHDRYLVVEAKGRSSGSLGRTLQRAKEQLNALPGPDGHTTSYASVAYFTAGLGQLRVVMRDPPDETGDLRLSALEAVLDHYDRILALVTQPEQLVLERFGESFRCRTLAGTGVTIGLAQSVIDQIVLLREGEVGLDEFLIQLRGRQAERMPSSTLQGQPAEFGGMLATGDVLPKAARPRIRELRVALRQVSDLATEQRATTNADGTLVEVDERFASEQMRLQPRDRQLPGQ